MEQSSAWASESVASFGSAMSSPMNAQRARAMSMSTGSFLRADSMRSAGGGSHLGNSSTGVGAGAGNVIISSELVTNCPYFSADGSLPVVDCIAHATTVAAQAKEAMAEESALHDLTVVSKLYRSGLQDDTEDHPWSIPAPPTDDAIASALTHRQYSGRRASVASNAGGDSRPSGAASPSGAQTPVERGLAQSDGGHRDRRKSSVASSLGAEGAPLPAEFQGDYECPLSSISVRAVDKQCALHVVRHSLGGSPDVARLRLARWVALQQDSLYVAWWAGAATPALLDASLIELVDRLDPTGCAAALASVVPGNPAPSSTAGSKSGEAGCGDAAADGADPFSSSAAQGTPPRAGVAVLQAAIELSPHKLKTALLVLEGATTDTIEYFFKNGAPKFGMHVVAFCDDNVTIHPGHGVGQLCSVRPLDLTIPDDERREQFAQEALAWMGCHATRKEELQLRERRKERDRVNAERRLQRLRDDPHAVVEAAARAAAATVDMSASQRSRHNATTTGRANEVHIDMEPEDEALIEAENAMADRVMQLQRLSRILNHSPTLLAIAHRFVIVLELDDLHCFVREVNDAVNMLRAWLLTKGSTLPGDAASLAPTRRLWGTSTLAAQAGSDARRSSDELATSRGAAGSHLSPATYASPGRRLSMGPLASLTPKALAAAEGQQWLNTTTPTESNPHTPTSRTKQLPPRRKSRTASMDQRRASAFASLSTDAVALVSDDGVPQFHQRMDPVGAARIATSMEAAGLLAVCLGFVDEQRRRGSAQSDQGDDTALVSFARGHTATSCGRFASVWTADDAAVLQQSVAFPAVVPVAVFGSNIVDRMANLGFWARLGKGQVLVSREVLAGIERLCGVIDATGKTKVGSCSLKSELLGGFVPSSLEQAFSLAGSWLHASYASKSRDTQWHRWQHPLTSFVVSEVARRCLFLPDASSLLLPPRAPPHDLTSLPALPPNPETWNAKLIHKLMAVLPDLDARRRHEDVAVVLERALAVALSLLQQRATAQAASTASAGASGTHRTQSVRFTESRTMNNANASRRNLTRRASNTKTETLALPIGPFAVIFCLFKELAEVYVKATMAGVAERFAERACNIARAVCGDRRDSPAMAEASFLLGRVQIQLSQAEATRGAAAQQAKVLNSDVGSNMQLTAYLRSDVERKQYVVDAAKHFSDAVDRWSGVPSSVIGDELAQCHRTLSAAMTHELRDRESLKCARSAADSAAGAAKAVSIPAHQQPRDLTHSLAVRESLGWATAKLSDFHLAIRTGRYDDAGSMLESSAALAYLATVFPDPGREENVVASGALGEKFARQMRPVATFREHLHAFTTFSDLETARHHGTQWQVNGAAAHAANPPTSAMHQSMALLSPSGAAGLRSPSLANMSFFSAGSAFGGGSAAGSVLHKSPDPHSDSVGSLNAPVALTPAQRRRTLGDGTQMPVAVQLCTTGAPLVDRDAAIRMGSEYVFAPHLLLETCDPSDVKALDLLAKFLDAGFDPRACSPHSMETLLHVAARRNLVLFIGLLLAHPLVEVEYAAKHRFAARRDGLSTIAVVEPVPSLMPSPLEVCDVPLTVELLILKGHSPLDTFRRNRALCVKNLVQLTSRLPKLFGADGGIFHDEVPFVLADDAIATESRAEMARFCPIPKLFECIERCTVPVLVAALTDVILAVRDVDPQQLDDVAQNDISARPLDEDLRAASAAAGTTYSRCVTARLAVATTVHVRAGRCACAAVVFDRLELTIDVMHWQDAAHFRKDRREAQRNEGTERDDRSTGTGAISAARVRMSERAKRAGVGAAAEKYVALFADLGCD